MWDLKREDIPTVFIFFNFIFYFLPWYDNDIHHQFFSFLGATPLRLSSKLGHLEKISGRTGE